MPSLCGKITSNFKAHEESVGTTRPVLTTITKGTRNMANSDSTTTPSGSSTSCPAINHTDVEWRPAAGYEGLYCVSSEGQVRSVARATTSGKLMTPQLNNSGYLRVSITAKGVSRYLYVHHLVARTFIGIRPDGMDINHINGVKTDNRAANLEYVSRTENMRHARELGLHDNRGEKHYHAKLTESLVIDILLAHSYCGVGAAEIARSVGVSPRTVEDVLERKTWRWVIWQ